MCAKNSQLSMYMEHGTGIRYQVPKAISEFSLVEAKKYSNIKWKYQIFCLETAELGKVSANLVNK